MKNMYIKTLLFALAGSLSLLSCNKDEAELIPTNVSACRYSPFPQGDGEYDKKIAEFQKTNDVYIIYKDIESKDINKAWVTSWSEVSYEIELIDPEDVGLYYEFYENNLFAYFPSRYLRFLPMYLYMLT